MIEWVLRLFRRRQLPPARTPNVSDFIIRQRQSRVEALQQKAASQKVTRELRRAHPLEAELMSRQSTEELRHDSQ